jgi:hypothetical protein
MARIAHLLCEMAVRYRANISQDHVHCPI